MTEPHTSPLSRWLPALLCSITAGLAAAAYTYTVRDQLVADAKSDAVTQNDERNKISARVDVVQNSLEALSGQPKADKADTDALAAQFTDVNSKLTAMTDRIAALEKKPAPTPAPVAPAPAPAAEPTPVSDSAALKLAATSGKPFATELTAWQKLHSKAELQAILPLAAAAQSGIPSEAEMNRRLREALDNAAHTKKVDDVSLIGKINTHLAGLVSIKKTADEGPYSKLRTDVTRDDIATLTTSVENLSEADRKPLEDWLTAAHARHDALVALSKLDTTEAE